MTNAHSAERNSTSFAPKALKLFRKKITKKSDRFNSAGFCFKLFPLCCASKKPLFSAISDY